MKYISTYQFRLTPKGEEYLEKLQLETVESPTLYREDLEELLFGVQVGRDVCLDSPLEVRALRFLLSHGYIEKDTRSVDDLVYSLPEASKARQLLGGYLELAREKVVSDEEVESLRAIAEEMFEGFEDPKQIWEDLRGAQTRGEKVLAIDSAIGALHVGVFTEEEIVDREEAWKALHKLRHEKV